jgi:2'-5' RNA ligase
MSETVRTFIAIEMPAEVRAFLDRCQERLKRAGGGVRWVRTDLVHLTLVFLGEVRRDRLAALEQAVRGAVAGFGPMTLAPSGAGRFPPKGRPRVVWVGIGDPAGSLLRLQKAVAEATADLAEKTEDRAYTAHLTLGRAQGGGDLHALSDAVDAMAAERGPEFAAGEVTVFRSDLSPQGPTYTALAKVALPQGDGA